jgi:hypothetical protein
MKTLRGEGPTIQWLESEEPAAEREPMERLSIDMPATLHRRFKMVCVGTDTLMIEEVLALIERRTAELEEGITAR